MPAGTIRRNGSPGTVEETRIHSTIAIIGRTGNIADCRLFIGDRVLYARMNQYDQNKAQITTTIHSKIVREPAKYYRSF
jgi:hypothetical protein